MGSTAREASSDRGFRGVADEFALESLDPAFVDDVVGNSIEQLARGDLAFECSDVCSEAGMVAVTESENALRITMDVEAIRILELSLVAIGGRKEKEDRLAGLEGLSVKLHGLRDHTPEELCRHSVAKSFSERVWNQLGVFDEL